MSEIRYIAKLQNGAVVEGSAAVASVEILKTRLAECGAEFIKIKESRGFFHARRRAMNANDAAGFARDLATILSSGVPLGDGLRALSLHTTEKRRRLFMGIEGDVEAGNSLADALDARAGIFTTEFVSAVRAGEKSGSLDQTLPRLASNLEWRAEMHAQIRQAVAYPLILIMMAFGLIALVALYLVPRLAEPLKHLGGELPWITRVVLGATEFAQNYYIHCIAAAAAAIGLFILLRRTIRGRLAIDRALLNIPVAGSLFIKTAGADFASSLGTHYKAGLPLNESLALLENSCGNRVIGIRFGKVREAVVQGGGLAEAAIRYLQFPPLVGQLLIIGEKTGTLEQSLERITKQLEAEARAAAKRLVAVAEPAAIVIAGAGVGTAIFAAILPILRMVEAVKR
ncbi:MAG: type II secretion system F family protein [Planctomycetes bacterium]|nr:type II secretion system F family protein [Planctomycetota bacterium]